MGNLIEKVELLVTSSLAEGTERAAADLELVPQAEKLSGYVVWSGFYGKPQRDRQHKLWEVLRGRLTLEEQAYLRAILTLTPAEYDTLFQDAD